MLPGLPSLNPEMRPTDPSCNRADICISLLVGFTISSSDIILQSRPQEFFRIHQLPVGNE
jgi:hypothetical protein